MANHRAGKRDASQVEHADATGLTVERSTVQQPGGKRKAVKPARAARSRVQPTAPHRAGHAAGRKNLLPGLPSAPSLVGAAALVVAATGAVTASNDVLPTPGPDGTSIQKLSAQPVQANASTGTSKISSADSADNRQRAVSRDSQREALEDAADQKLQAAAEAQAKERDAALQQLAASAEQHADEIAEQLAARKEELAANRWVLPLSNYELTAQFGYSSGLWASTHTGLDFAAPAGTPIVSVASGVVTSTAYDGAYGNRTIITLDDGTEIWYCHQTSFAVSQGESVAAGQTIGTVGSTGNSTGPHLHLEVRPGAGDPVDPYAALVARGLTP